MSVVVIVIIVVVIIIVVIIVVIIIVVIIIVVIIIVVIIIVVVIVIVVIIVVIIVTIPAEDDLRAFLAFHRALRMEGLWVDTAQKDDRDRYSPPPDHPMPGYLGVVGRG